MKIQKKFFKIHMVVFFLFGFIAFMGLYETTPIAMIESQITGRDPASVAPVIIKSTEIIKIDCSEFNQEIHVPAYHVRLEGYLCDKNSNSENIKLENITTGKNATLFHRGNAKYMTDFIQLKEGKNQIQLSYILKDHSIKKLDLTLIR